DRYPVPLAPGRGQTFRRDHPEQAVDRGGGAIAELPGQQPQHEYGKNGDSDQAEAPGNIKERGIGPLAAEDGVAFDHVHEEVPCAVEEHRGRVADEVARAAAEQPIEHEGAEASSESVHRCRTRTGDSEQPPGAKDLLAVLQRRVDDDDAVGERLEQVEACPCEYAPGETASGTTAAEEEQRHDERLEELLVEWGDDGQRREVEEDAPTLWERRELVGGVGKIRVSMPFHQHAADEREVPGVDEPRGGGGAH